MQGEQHPKKILYMITKGVWGGAQEYVYTLATELSQKNFTATVLTGEGNALSEKLEDRGIKTYSLPTLIRDISVRKEFHSFISLIKIIRAEKPDILHLNSSKIGLLGALAGRIARVPRIVFTAHGWPFNEERNVFEKSLIALASWMTTFLSHKTIVIAQREMKQAHAFPLIPKHKISLIHNGIGTIDFLTKKDAQGKISSALTIHSPKHTHWIGTIAELHTNKGLEYAISALSRIHTPYIYCIIGEGEHRKYLEKIIEQHSLKEKVFLLGNIPDARKLLKAFSIFILPSIKEGLPYALLEAGQAECTVIASKIGGIPEIIENGVSGILVNKKSKTEITRAIEYILEHPEEGKEMSRTLHHTVTDKFSIKEMIEKTITVYTEKY